MRSLPSRLMITAITFSPQYLICCILMGRKRVHSVLCIAVQPFKKNGSKKPNSIPLPRLLLQNKLGISLGFSCKQLSWEGSNPRGLAFRIMYGLGHLWPVRSHFMEHCESDFVSAIRAGWCKLRNECMLSTVLTWCEECLLNYLRSEIMFSNLHTWSLSP